MKSLSLRLRIYFSMLALIILSFFVIGAVTVYHFNKENEVYHSKRLLRKERAIMASIDYFLQQKDTKQNPDSVVLLFNDKICELADINVLDINIFNLKGELLISSHTDYFETGVFVFQLEKNILKSLNSDSARYVRQEKVDSLSIVSTYRYILDTDKSPLAIINIPYFQSNEQLNKELNSYLTTLLEIYIAFFIVASILAFFLSNYITSSLKTISDKLKNIDLGKTNNPLEWNSNDEIGALVAEYNRMLKELEESAEIMAKSEREGAWREMAKQVAHEIKNPLTPMKLSMQYLQHTWDANNAENWKEKLDKVANTIIEQIDTLSNIASEFSNFAQMPKAKNENININELIESVVSLFQNTPNVFLSYKLDAKKCIVNADKDLMQRVFNNLIKNSIQAIPENENGNISVKTSQKENSILIEVKDNGCGISDDKKEKIFRPNFTTKTSGTGLGLAMVKNIIVNANGSIWFETTQDKGSIFYIEIPCV